VEEEHLARSPSFTRPWNATGNWFKMDSNYCNRF